MFAFYVELRKTIHVCFIYLKPKYKRTPYLTDLIMIFCPVIKKSLVIMDIKELTL